MVHKLVAEAKLQAVYPFSASGENPAVQSVESAFRTKYPDSKTFKIVAIDSSGMEQWVPNYGSYHGVIGIQAMSHVSVAYDFDKTPFSYGNAVEAAVDALNVPRVEYEGKKVFGKYKRGTGLLQSILSCNMNSVRFAIICTVYELQPNGQYCPVKGFMDYAATNYAMNKFRPRCASATAQREWYNTWG